MKKLFPLLLLTSLLLCAPALADDVYVARNVSGETISTDRSYLQVVYDLDGPTDVTLSICDEWGTLIYRRDHGTCTGTFRSEEIYLPLSNQKTDYSIQTQLGGRVSCFTLRRVMPLTTDTCVSSAGLPVMELSGASSPRSVYILDVYAMEGMPPTVVPMVSGGVQLGWVTFSVRNGLLTVSADLTASGTIDRAYVYLAPDALTASTLDTRRYSGERYRLGKKISCVGTPYAAVLVQLTVSYDPGTADMARQDASFQREQRERWELMQRMTVNDAVG